MGNENHSDVGSRPEATRLVTAHGRRASEKARTRAVRYGPRPAIGKEMVALVCWKTRRLIYRRGHRPPQPYRPSLVSGLTAVAMELERGGNLRTASASQPNPRGFNRRLHLSSEICRVK